MKKLLKPLAAASLSLLVQTSEACTGFTLKAEDGAVVFGRTLEWGSFEMKTRLMITPQGAGYGAVLAS